MNALSLTLMYLLAAVLGVVACRSLKLPPMLGYLVVGVVLFFLRDQSLKKPIHNAIIEKIQK